MKHEKLVSIISVNYNQADVTCQMLASVKKLNYRNIEVIVVDNGSAEDPEEKIRKVFPECKIIHSKENLGFAGGNNLGIKAAKGDFLFFVNNDTELTEDIIENLLVPFETMDDLGVVSPKIYYYDQPEIIQFAGYTHINPCTARNNTIGQFEADHGQYDVSTTTPYAHGAAMMVRREVIEKTGLMPEVFFLYYEELDWSEQIRKAGFKIIYEPSARIYHKESVTTGSLSPLKIYYLTRNRILFMRRNATRFHLLLFTLFLAFFTIPKNILLYCIKGDFDLARSFVKGIMWNISHNVSLNYSKS